MSIATFQLNLSLIKNFAVKLTKESVSTQGKKVLLKTYASHLYLNLTDNMINEILRASSQRLPY